jgi:hypothetical protein
MEGYRRKPGTRSNTKLVVSGGDSPAELWLAKQDLPKLFDYPYGGPGQTDVIISKGMMVAVDTAANSIVRDYDTNRIITQITIANGDPAYPNIGMTPYNICRKVDDRFTGNQPSIITREYVELPYFPSSTDAMNCLWGNVSGGVKAGDYLKVSSDPNLRGRMVKWNRASDSWDLVCAQVLAREPLGSNYDFLEWVMWPDAAKREDDLYMNKSGYAAPGLEGYPFDPTTFSKDGTGGLNDMTGYLSNLTTTPTGVQGITDGQNSRNTQLTKQLGIIPAGTAAGQTSVFFVQPNLIQGQIQFSVGGAAIPETDPKLSIDYAKGFVRYTPTAAVATDAIVSVIYRAMQYGTPVITDFNGADGVVRLLLKF